MRSIATRLLAGYAVTGPADASATVLCFNPGGANLISWEIASELLAAAGVRLVLHDCRGLGFSDVPAAHDAKEDFDAQFHFDTYSDDAAALLAHLGITEPVVIAGSSWGARPAAATGARFGAQASALVLFDISFGKADRPVQESGERLARDKAKRLGINEPRLDFSRIAGGEKAMRTTMATAKAPYGEGESFTATVLPEGGGGIVCPTLVAMGYASPAPAPTIRSPRHEQRRCWSREFDPNLVTRPGGANEVFASLQGRGAEAELRIMEACGHASVLHRPTLVANVLLDYLIRQGLHHPSDGVAEAAAAVVAEHTSTVPAPAPKL